MICARRGFTILTFEFAPSWLRRRMLRILPFQQERDADSDKKESPNQEVVDVDHTHTREQKDDTTN